MKVFQIFFGATVFQSQVNAGNNMYSAQTTIMKILIAPNLNKTASCDF